MCSNEYKHRPIARVTSFKVHDGESDLPSPSELALDAVVALEAKMHGGVCYANKGFNIGPRQRVSRVVEE